MGSQGVPGTSFTGPAFLPRQPATGSYQLYNPTSNYLRGIRLSNGIYSGITNAGTATEALSIFGPFRDEVGGALTLLGPLGQNIFTVTNAQVTYQAPLHATGLYVDSAYSTTPAITLEENGSTFRCNVNCAYNLSVTGNIQGPTIDALTARSSATPWTSSFTNWQQTQQYYRVGVLTADQGGEMLRLSVIACGYTYLLSIPPSTTPLTQPYEIVLYFFTGDGSKTIPVTGNTSGQANTCMGFGWGTHTSNYKPPLGVFVAPTPGNTSRYEFWVSLALYSGRPLVTASTTAQWTPSLAGPSSALPTTGWLQLQLYPVMHGGTTTTSGVKVPL
jgi:hypothetical protein